MLAGDSTAPRRASTSRPTCSTTARSAIVSSMRSRAPPSAASTVRIVLDPIGSSLGTKSTRSAEGRRREARLVQSARLLQPRRVPTTAPIARRSSSTATSRSPAAWASPITGSATRRTRSTGATPISGSPVPPCARSKASFYENWIETGGLLGAGARSGAAAARHRRALGRGVEQPDGRRQQHQAAISAGDRRRQEDDRHPVAVHHARSVHAVEPRPSARARRRDSHAGRGRHHRRHAGQARQPLRLPAAARRRLSRSSSTSRR